MHLRCKLNSVLKWCLLSPHPLRNCLSTEVVCILCYKKPLRKREREDVRTGIRRPGLGKVVWPPWALVFRPIKWKRGARWSCDISSNSKTVDWELDVCNHDTPFTFIPLCNHHNSKTELLFFRWRNWGPEDKWLIQFHPTQMARPALGTRTQASWLHPQVLFTEPHLQPAQSICFVS